MREATYVACVKKQKSVADAELGNINIITTLTGQARFDILLSFSQFLTYVCLHFSVNIFSSHISVCWLISILLCVFNTLNQNLPISITLLTWYYGCKRYWLIAWSHSFTRAEMPLTKCPTSVPDMKVCDYLWVNNPEEQSRYYENGSLITVTARNLQK